MLSEPMSSGLTEPSRFWPKSLMCEWAPHPFFCPSPSLLYPTDVANRVPVLLLLFLMSKRTQLLKELGTRETEEAAVHNIQPVCFGVSN